MNYQIKELRKFYPLICAQKEEDFINIFADFMQRYYAEEAIKHSFIGIGYDDMSSIMTMSYIKSDILLDLAQKLSFAKLNPLEEERLIRIIRDYEILARKKSILTQGNIFIKLYLHIKNHKILQSIKAQMGEFKIRVNVQKLVSLAIGLYVKKGFGNEEDFRKKVYLF